MTDARLRELERRWRESGTDADEAAYLRERARAGALPPERLAAAAACGHAAACLALGAEPSALRGLLVELVARPGPGRELALRAVVAASRVASPQRLVQARKDELLAVERWVLCPCEQHRVVVRGVDGAVGPDDDPQLEPPGDEPHLWFLVRRLRTAVVRADDAAALVDLGLAARAIERFSGAASVRDALREELVPWLLGRDDPLRRRHRPA